MDALMPASMQCPYCWEQVDILVDCSTPSQAYVEDCSVCCNPILVMAEIDDDGAMRIDARRENE